MAGQFADDGGVGAGVGEVCAEGVAQHVGGAAVLGQIGGLGVAGDDPCDIAGGELAGRAGARQREQQYSVAAAS